MYIFHKYRYNVKCKNMLLDLRIKKKNLVKKL